ncbi:DNA/RNA non-specific endonuclease [Bacteroides stercorirosoris]|uniref:DNA/RNA non-specific endonuclease n=1 Tax=Bacteroides stercorirosoris TaxID=871324 RepID=UPI000B05A185|nr:DNA/RNA non-specific endonuclease [Bacteroides stercorirosoris]
MGIEYVASDDVDVDNTNPVNSNKADNLEIPALNATNQYIEYYAGMSDEEGAEQVLNFSLEYIASKKHSAWVAFSFDPVTSQDNIKRTNEWNQDDPNIDNSVEVTESMHKSDGYDKGHICASEDRVYSVSANKQTFYYSNISPQIGSFNQKYWAALEKQVQTWGRSTINGTYDKLYVVKGGTTNRLLTNFTGVKKANDGLYPTTNAAGLTPGGLICPSYYYMALLSEKAGVYHAIAFLVPHSELLPEKPDKDEFMAYAVSIENLEYETGIDFFCNLPNEVEKKVEAVYSEEDWAW